MKTLLPRDEAARLEALREYEVLDTAPEPEFDDLTHLAAQICAAPIAVISLVDDERLWFKSRVGMDAPEIPRAVSFCTQAIEQNDFLLVPDTFADDRFINNGLVNGDPHIRFYAGVPLVTPEGHAVGTLCVLDTVPRQLDETQQESLHRLARQAVALLEARPDATARKGQSRQTRRRAERRKLALAAQAARRDADNLEASETRYRRLFESAKDGILILDAQSGEIEDVNPSLCGLLGYAPDELVGRPLWDIGAFRAIAASSDAFRTVQEEEYSHHGELPLETRDGQIAAVEFVSNAYASGGKKVVQCHIRDISERKQAVAAEQESQRFLQSTLDALAAHIAVLDETGQIIAVNKAWRQFSAQNQGTAASCEVGANYLLVCGEADGTWAEEAPAVVRGIREVMSGQHQAFCLEYPCHSPSEERWFNVCVTRFCGEGPLRVVVAHENITARKLAKEKLRRSEANLARAQQIAHLGSWVWSLQNLEVFKLNPLSWSDEVFRIFGYEPDALEVSYQVFINGVHPDDRAAVEAKLHLAFETGQNYDIEHRIVRPDGTERVVRERSEIVYAEDGKPLQMIGTVQDITERKRAEEELRAGQIHHRAILQSALDAIVSMDQQGRVLEWNPAAEKMFGYEREFALGHSMAELIVPPSLREQHWKGLNRYLQSGEAVLLDRRSEITAMRADGSEFPVELAITRHSLEGPPIFSGYIRDITERKQVENALRESEERFASIVANVPGMVYQFVLHPDGSIEWPFVSEGCREIYETEPETFQIDPHWPLKRIHPDDREEFDRSVAASAKTLSPWHWEGRHILGSGEIIWIQGASRPQRLPDGGTQWDGLVMNITALKQAERALHKANDELELHVMQRTAELGAANESLRVENIQHHMTMGSLRATADALQAANEVLKHNETRLLQGNRVFTDLTRLRASEMAELETALQQITEAVCQVLDAERCSVWLYHEDHSALRCVDLYEIATQTHSQDAELTSKDFPAYFEALEAEPIVVADEAHTHPATREFSEPYLQPLGVVSMLDTAIVLGGRMTGVLCCERTGVARPWKVDDQTFAGSAAAICAVTLESYERARAETEMRRAREEADAANLAKSEFLSRMSHELRTPLNSILGFGQILDEQNGTALQKESVGYILKAGRHLLDLINEVLDIARVESGHLEISSEPIALDDVVPEACALMQPLAGERKIRLEENTSQLGHSYILADRQRLRQVLINLISNAIKYNREGGEVEVVCAQKPDGWTSIAVRDTGQGIAPQDLPKLFTPFERLSASNSNVEGTGLGLVLSQRLVTGMGGTLQVESTLDQGTTVTLELPQTTSPEEQLANSPHDTHSSVPKSQAQRTHSVLSIEDNPANFRLLEVLFQSRPELTLLAALQGSEGLEMARQHEPDLILLDLNLPDMHGKEVLARLQQSALTRDIPVVVVSADATPNQVERLLSAGAGAYLSKPLDVKKFLHTLDMFLPTTPAIAPQPNIDEKVVN